MDAQCRLLLLQFICLVWPTPPHVAVDSFVLRRRSAVDDERSLADSAPLYAIERFDRPDTGYVDGVEEYGDLPQEVQDYETNNYDVDGGVDENLMDFIGPAREEEEEAAEQDYEDFNDRDYLDDDDRTWAGPLIADTEGFDSISDNDNGEDDVYPAAKVPLDKKQLTNLFTDHSEQPVEQDVYKKRTELSKNEVQKLFDSMDGNAEIEVDSGDLPKVEKNISEIEIEVPVSSSTDVEKIVKSVEELKTGDNDGAVADKVVDVKEETISPEDGKKVGKELVMELVQPEDDGFPPQLDESSGRISKRSMDVQDEFEVAAKQRAVDLLKTYIKLQEDENRHLTAALNLATLAQTQRTDRYLDDEVEHLRYAVGDEAAIETLRDMIRADGDASENVEDEIEDQEQDGEGDEAQDQEEVEDYSEDNDDASPLDYVPVKREDSESEPLGELLIPPTLVDDEPLQEDLEDDEDDAEEYEKYMLLRERLRRYLLQKELDSIQNQIEDDDDYDIDSEWLMSKLSPQYVNVYSDSRLNPFTRKVYEAGRLYDKRYDSLDEDSDDDAYIRDPDWLKDLETAAAIAELHNAVEASPAYEDSDVCPALYELTDDCLAATERQLTLDDEATQLCNRHQLCYSCGAEFGLAAGTCDEGYLREADLLCSRQSASEQGMERCRGEAAGLFVIMTEEHRYSPPGLTPDICRDRCAYDFVASGR